MVKAILICIVLINLVGCDSPKNTPTDPAHDLNPFHILSAGDTSVSDFQLFKSKTVGVTDSTSTSYTRIRLWDPDTVHPVYGGTLTVEGRSIKQYHYNAATAYQDTFSFAMDGSVYSFATTGATGFPTFSDSLQAPVGETFVSYPRPGDTVSQSGGFTITWQGSGADGVVIMVSDTSMANNHPAFSHRLNSDPGSYTVSSANLAGLYQGPITVRVIRGNYRSGYASSDHAYRMLIFSQYEVLARLGP